MIMTSQVRYCSVECNWTSCQDHCLDKIVVFQHEIDLNTESEPASYVAPEGCLMEKQNSTVGDCQLTIITRPPQYNFHISAIDVLCCAKHMEVFTSKNEYLDTCKGAMVQEQEDKSKLYCLQYSFENAMTGCAVKLKSLQCSKRLWFHSIYVTLVPGPQEMPNPLAAAMGQKALDMEKVRSLVGESELSQGAQQLMASLEAQRTQSSSSPMAGLGMMMQMFSQMKVASAPGQSKASLQPQTASPKPLVTDGRNRSHEQSVESKKSVDTSMPREDQQPPITEQHFHLQRSSAETSGIPEKDNIDPIAKLLDCELEKLEERMLVKVEGLIKQSEDRICARITQLLLTKSQGDDLGLD